MLRGTYVKTFAEASHALPQGMSLNADYPFMLPRIRRLAGKELVIVGYGDREATVKVIRRGGAEHAFIEQVSSFERLFNRKPTRFRLLPFKDENTPAAAVAAQ